MIKLLNFLGSHFLSIVNISGSITMMFFDTVRLFFVPPFRLKLLFKQIEFIGINSLSVIVLTGSFTGMVFAFQSYIGFQQFGAEQIVGTVVALGMARELGPVLSAIMVAARAGSAMTAEIGTMKVTEQVDALNALGVDPVQYLFVPRILAGFIVMPMLNAIAVFCGIVGGFVVSISVLGINKTLYIEYMFQYIELGDFMNGMVKAFVFGGIVTLVGCYKGYMTTGGAEGVGKSTTQSVVMACVMILIFDYVLTAFMF